jgi:hypothetical protein
VVDKQEEVDKPVAADRQEAVDKQGEADKPGVAARAGAADRQEEAHFVAENWL